ncbi:MAG: hypothetical protein HC877_22770 [Thioploca sp.]|nr:hypothetical protein [Thioploca sp.]
MGAIKDAKLESIISNSSEVSKTTGILSQLNKDLAWELAQIGVDTTGIVDPSPTSDAIGMGLSLVSGDRFGAGLSLISMIPFFLGDALGKSAKMARAAQKIAALKKKIEGAVTAIIKAKKAARAAIKYIMTA